MSYDIIVRFPSKKLAQEFTGQMSDGVGESFCDFSYWQKLPNTDGTKASDFVKVTEGETPVFFVNSIFEQ
jgi:hypothetical protein